MFDQMSIIKVILLTILFIFTILFTFILGLFIDINELVNTINIYVRLVYSLFLILILYKHNYLEFDSANKNWLYLIPFLIPLNVNLIAIAITGSFNYQGFDMHDFIINVLFYISVAVVEELFFRGLIFTELFNRINCKFFIALSIIISSIIFGLFHFINLRSASLFDTIAQVFYSTFSGALFCFIYYFSQNITLAIISHFIYNISNSYLYELFYGGEYNIYFIIISVVIGFLTIVYALYLFGFKEVDLDI